MDIRHEQELVRRAKESLEAFDELYDHYLPKIYSYIYNRVSNKEIAEDLVSKTFIKGMTKIKKFEYRGYTFGAWLYKIAHNTLMDYFRSNPNRNTDIEAAGQIESKDDHATQSEYQSLILHALKELPSQYQQVLSLKFFEEMSNQEIADVLGCSINSATVKAHRGLKALEKVLKRQGYPNLAVGNR